MNSKTNIRFIFFGTPERAVTTLDILKSHNLVPQLIVTAPDRPQGRGLTLQSPLVKTWADEHTIPTLQPEKLDDIFRAEIEKQSWDVAVVVAYGKILPQWLLDLPVHGGINVHYSLLPLYRGATPVETQILEGAEIVGVTIMQMHQKLDYGPILTQLALPMPDPLPSNPELTNILAHAGGELLAETLPDWIEGKIEPQEQNHKKATFTRKFEKSEGQIDLRKNPEENFRKIKAFDPWPRAFTVFHRNGKSIRTVISTAHLENNTLIIDKVIPAGKPEVDFQDWSKSLDEYKDK